MKKLVLITKTLLILSIMPATAQVIPNYNFENWSAGATSPPDGWDDKGSNHPGFYPTVQTTDHYLGLYAVKLENKITATDTTRAAISTTRPNNSSGLAAFPIAARYNNLKGFYKYIPLNGDSAQLIVFLTKTGYANSGGYGNMAAFGELELGTASTYSPFSVGCSVCPQSNFYYDNSNTVIPDSAFIEISAYKEIQGANHNLQPLGNSILYVDALNFDSYLSGINEHLNITSNFKLFPNITSGNFDVSFETSQADYTTIKAYDFDGREVMSFFSGNLNIGVHSFHYDVQSLCSGSYLFVVATGSGYKTEKFQINR